VRPELNHNRDSEMKKSYLIIPLVTLLYFSFDCSHKSSAKDILQYGTAQDVGMSEEQLEQAVNLFKVAVGEDRVTGVHLLVARHGRVVLHEGLGLRDLENHLPMEKDSHIRMASITKPVVASGVLKLAEEGLLDLEDPIRPPPPHLVSQEFFLDSEASADYFS